MLRSSVIYRKWYGKVGLTLVLLLLTRTSSAQATAKEPPVSFINDVGPILKESCFGCHGPKSPKGKLDMTTYESLRKGGTKDDPIVEGKPDESYLINVLKAADSSRMPPKTAGDPLLPQKIALIERWVAEGAKLDAGLTPKSDLRRELRLRWKPPAPPAVYAFPATITALAFTPDNKQLVISGHHELTVWDVATTKLVKRVATRALRTLALVFLTDGKLAAAGGQPGEEGNVCIYDINGGTPRTENGVTFLDGVNDRSVMLKRLLDIADEVFTLALSPDGKKLASGSYDRMVNLWDLTKGYKNAKLEATIENHADWVLSVAFSPDSKHLITGSRDKTAKVWDLAAKECVLTFPEHQNSVYGVAIKSDGKVGYSVGEDAQLRAWNLSGNEAGKQIHAANHRKAALKVLVHPWQPWLVTCGADQVVHVWHTDTLRAIKTLRGHTDYICALAVSPDGQMMASGSFNGEIKVWKLPDDKPFKAFNASPGSPTLAGNCWSG